MNIIAFDLAAQNVSDLATSALPDAPVVPDPVPHRSRLRITVAARLRPSTRGHNRLDPYVRPLRHAS
jgi:hypothetical protein